MSKIMKRNVQKFVDDNVGEIILMYVKENVSRYDSKDTTLPKHHDRISTINEKHPYHWKMMGKERVRKPVTGV